MEREEEVWEEREMQKLEVWRKNKCRRSGQSTSAEWKKTKAELRSRS